MVSGVERARIPVTVLTGFLGSGETTLLNRVLRSPRFADTAVVVNELGLYDGWTFRGWPVATIVRGETVMHDGRMVGRGGWGRGLHRGVRPA